MGCSFQSKMIIPDIEAGSLFSWLLMGFSLTSFMTCMENGFLLAFLDGGSKRSFELLQKHIFVFITMKLLFLVKKEKKEMLVCLELIINSIEDVEFF